MRIWRTGAMAVIVAVLLPSTASGSRRFPAEIATDLVLSYQPACSLCHVKGNTGPGTANTPVALSMKARGLQSGGRSSVSSSLAALDSDRVDSDGDGVTDVDELRMGTDPNSPEPTPFAGRVDPAYGCSVGRSHGRTDERELIAMAAASVVWLLRRRRKLGVPTGSRSPAETPAASSASCNKGH